MMDSKRIALEISALGTELKCQNAIEISQAVLHSIERDTFHLAILGEFKRGKSTFVNSLLEDDLLPTDVLPSTAVLNVIEFSDMPECQVNWQSGESETWELSKASLARLAVGGDIEAENVKFALIKTPSPLLRDGLVLIDTPGVNDLSQSRVEITQGILPNVDAAIFLLDATAPVTRSEADFLITKVLSQKLESILFVIAKADRLDEEEIEESIEGAKSRLHGLFGFTPIVIPYSSRSVMKENKATLMHPNKRKLLDHLSSLKDAANKSKEERINARLKLALANLESELGILESLYEADETKVRKYKASLDLALESHQLKFEQLMTSVDMVGRTTLLKMFKAGAARFQERLEEDFNHQIALCDNNLEKYWQKQLPIQLEKAIRQFSEEKTHEMYIYLQKFTEHVGVEYNKNFEIPLLLQMETSGLCLPKWKAAAIATENNSQIENIIAQAVPISLGGILGYLFMPGIGTLIGSFLGQIIGGNTRELRNEQLKDTLQTQLPVFLNEVISSYVKGAEQVISQWFDSFGQDLIKHHQRSEGKFTETITARLNSPGDTSKLDMNWLQDLKSKAAILSQRLNN